MQCDCCVHATSFQSRITAFTKLFTRLRDKKWSAEGMSYSSPWEMVLSWGKTCGDTNATCDSRIWTNLSLENSAELFECAARIRETKWVIAVTGVRKSNENSKEEIIIQDRQSCYAREQTKHMIMRFLMHKRSSCWIKEVSLIVLSWFAIDVMHTIIKKILTELIDHEYQ